LAAVAQAEALFSSLWQHHFDVYPWHIFIWSGCMKNPKKEGPLSRRRPLKKRKTTIEPFQTTKLQGAFKEEVRDVGNQPADLNQHPKRVSKGADEEME
jgi:hypothetical protein